MPRVLAGLSLALTASVVGVLPASPALAAAPPLPTDVTAISTPFVDPRGDFVIARTTTNAVLYGRDDPSFVNLQTRFYQTLAGATVQGDPVAANVPNGVLVFARDTSNQVVTNFIANRVTPTGFTVLPGLLVSSDIEVVELPDVNGQVLRIFARGLDDGAVYTNLLTTGGWTGWRSLGGFITSEISAALSPAAGTGITIAVRGGDNRVFTGTMVDDIFIEWRALGGPTVTGNIGLLPGRGTADPRGNEIFVVDSATRNVMQVFLNTGFFRNLGGVATSDAAPVTLVDGSVEFFVRGTNNRLYANRRLPGQTNFGGYANLGGILTSNPGLGGGPGDPTATIVVRGENQRLFINFQRSGFGNFGFTGYFVQSNILVA